MDVRTEYLISIPGRENSLGFSIGLFEVASQMMKRDGFRGIGGTDGRI
jgi:hypothetical protein